MRAASAALLLIFVSCDVPPKPEPEPDRLELTVTPEGELKVGKYFKLKALITNRGKHPVDVVMCLDHSDVGWRFPVMRAQWTGPDGERIGTGIGGGCGNSDSLMDKHVIRLRPGKSFDPFGASPYGNCTLAAYLKDEGKHTVALTVDYSAREPEEWNGRMERGHIDPEVVRKRLANVPKVKLEARTEFEVSR